MDLQREFEVPGIAGAGDGAECRATEASVRIAQGWRIRYVERFGPELQIEPLGDVERFPDHQVRVLQAGAANGIAGTCANQDRKSTRLNSSH